ncbi:chromate efflux transporter [Leucobacter zeae]|nr:chromate efflux transporter [Leucobacter zeae]
MERPATGGGAASTERGSAGEVFAAFLRLGLLSFGGPIAHLGYFRAEFVERRRWLDDREYGSLVALCQFLPGPASSQVGFAIGLRRAGGLGALAAFVAFTLPSAALMLAFAAGAAFVSGPVGTGILRGLGIVAVAIVAEAVLGMARSLAPDRARGAILVAAAAAALLLPGAWGQVSAIGIGALAGLLLCRAPADALGAPLAAPARVTSGRSRVGRTLGAACLALFAVLLLAGPTWAAATARGVSGAEGGSAWSGSVAQFDAFFHAGALVFGGGHVVLPLLQSGVVETGWVSNADFLAGYGAAQAMPGPLFSFAAYLGAVSTAGPGGALGALVALTGIFLPGFLLLVGVLPFWEALSRRTAMQALVRGANAAVVGVLAAALYSPVFTTAIVSPAAFCLALACFAMRTVGRVAPGLVVLAGSAGGVLLELLAV